MRCKIHSLTDPGAILSIEVAAQAFPWNTQKIKDSLMRSDAIGFGAWKREVLCGYILGGSVLDEGEIWNFAVLPDYRRQGIGRQLLTTLLNYFKAQSVKKVFLEVRGSNKAAIWCYQNAGFKQVGIRRAYYEQGTGREDAILMRLS